MKLNLIKNSILNTISFLLSSGLWIILIPFIILHIGLSNYGLWTIGSIVISTTNYLNLGLPTALTRATTEALSQKNGWLLRWLLKITDLIFITISIIIFLIILVFKTPIINQVFGIIEIDQVNLLYILLPAIVPVSLIFMMGLSRKAILDGFQEIHLTSRIGILGRLTNFCITIILILVGKGILGLFIASASENILVFIIYHHLASRRIYTLDLTKRQEIHPWNQLSNKISYGIKLQLSNLASYGVELFYKSFISSRLGVSTLGEFQIVWRVIQIGQGFLTSIIDPIFPASSLLSDQNDRKGLWLIFKKASYYATLLTISIFSLAIPFSGLIFKLWIGQVSSFQIITFQVMCVWVAFSTLASPGYCYLMGKGNSKAILVVQLVSSLVAIIIATLPILLTPIYPWEFIGISYAMFGVVSFITIFIFTNLAFRWPLQDMIIAIIHPRTSIIGISLSIIIFALITTIPGNMLQQILMFLFAGLCLMALYFYTMPKEDKDLLGYYILQIRRSI